MTSGASGISQTGAALVQGIDVIDSIGCALNDISVQNNTKAYLVHRFAPTVTSEVRVVVMAANCRDDIDKWKKYNSYNTYQKDFPRVRQIEVYKLGPAKAFENRSKSRVVTIEKSQKGRIAIFKDNVPMPEGVASSPDHLAEVLRAAGYGVTFLDAELLSNTALLSRDHFDLFIHPYGCSFPLGTTLYEFLEAGGHLLTIGGQAFTNALACSADGNQHVIDTSIRINKPLTGYPATGLTGQVIPIEEEARYVSEGKEMAYILQTREGTKKIGKMHRIGQHGEEPLARVRRVLLVGRTLWRRRGSSLLSRLSTPLLRNGLLLDAQLGMR